MTATNTNATANGPARKTLASQLDRLDAILDALGEGLRAALAEVLTNPDVLALLPGRDRYFTTWERRRPGAGRGRSTLPVASCWPPWASPRPSG